MNTSKLIYLLLGVLFLSITACDNLIETPPTPTVKIDTEIYTYSESFKDGLGQFTHYNDSGKQTWSATSNQYVMMNGNVDNVPYANEDWLISPVINLPAGVSSVVTFDYLTQGFASLSTEATIWISENYSRDSLFSTATWTQLSTVEPMVNAVGWNMTNAGDISLKAYMGKSVTIAFKYVSTNIQAGIWQVKNFSVKEKKPVTLPYTESFASTKGKFTAINVSGAQTWKVDFGYAIMTGYVNSTNNANEDWLISPQIDLTKVSSAKLTFDHVTRYFGNIKSDATVWVSENYDEGLPETATWTQLSTFPFSDPGSWPKVFPSSREISLTSYAGKSITIAFKYISTAAKAGTWEMKNFKVQEGEAFVENFGKGTETSPYNVAGAIVLQGTSSWVKGYIVGYTTAAATSTVYTFSTDTCTQTTNILVADTITETDPAKCITVQLPTGAVRTGLNLKDIKANLHKQVLLYGSLEAYFSKPGMKNTSYYELEGGTTGGTKPIDYSTAFLYEPFATSLGAFSTQSVTGAQVWASTSFGATMTGFVSSVNNANEDWLISPQIDLTKSSTATLTFDHVIRYATNPITDCTVWVSENYNSGLPDTATWIQITTPVFVNASSWTLTSTGPIDLTLYSGKKIKLAFKYLSTATKAGTWEIKNLVVK